ANATTQSANRRTIPPQAVTDALHELELSDFVPRVEAELSRFNEIQTNKRNDYRRKVKEAKKEEGGGGGERGGRGEGGEGTGGGNGSLMMTGQAAEKDGEAGRVAKRARMSEIRSGKARVNGHSLPTGAASATTAGARSSSPSAQLRSPKSPSPQHQRQQQHEVDPNEEAADEEEEEEEPSQANPAEEEEDDEDEQDEDADEDEEEEDDADEYPDAGRRAESIEMDPHSSTEWETRGRYGQYRRDGPGPYSSDEDGMEDD
ncbi:MAG: hypothetical protein Q9163_006150, partial [Psora crenata]